MLFCKGQQMEFEEFDSYFKTSERSDLPGPKSLSKVPGRYAAGHVRQAERRAKLVHKYFRLDYKS